MMTYIGLTVGPSFGGWLTQSFGWRSVFYINVPVGALALILSLVFIPQDHPAEKGQRFNFVGRSLFMSGLTSLLLGLNKGADWGRSSLPVVVLLVGSAILMMKFFLSNVDLPP